MYSKPIFPACQLWVVGCGIVSNVGLLRRFRFTSTPRNDVSPERHCECSEAECGNLLFVGIASLHCIPFARLRRTGNDGLALDCPYYSRLHGRKAYSSALYPKALE
ncbi:MAG: hypothetical protein Q7U65_04870 [Bacteroidota bacterium]|nr:hypothetical protein [Bacteroidota bacterium]